MMSRPLAGGLPPQVDASMVHTAFSVFGDIVDVQLPKDTQSECMRCCFNASSSD